jgi:hypothetical protein
MVKRVPKVAGGSFDTQVNKEEPWAIYRQTPPHRAGFSFFLAKDCEYRGRKGLSAGSRCDIPHINNRKPLIIEELPISYHKRAAWSNEPAFHDYLVGIGTSIC